MEIAGLSDKASRLALAVLGWGQEADAGEIGKAAGITRRGTIREAARELAQREVVVMEYGEHGRLLLVPGPAILSLLVSPLLLGREVTDREPTVSGTDIDIDTDSGSESISINYSRVTSFVAPGGTVTVQPSTESVQPGTETDHLPIRGGTETDQASTETDQADTENDHLLEAVMAADEMIRGEESNQRYSPYVLRRKAQLAALKRLWADAFHITPPSDHSLGLLLVENNNDAYPIAVMVRQVVESGKQVQSPYSYIRAALKNQREKAEKLARSSRSDEDDEELSEPTPEFLAQMARTKQVASQLWGA